MDLDGLSPLLASVVARVVEARPVCGRLVIQSSAVGAMARFRSPSGDVQSDIVLWHDAPENGGLGVGFRAWHTHPEGAEWTRDAGDDLSSFVAVVLAIVDGELVGLVDPAPRRAQLEPLVDLCDPNGLIEELTSPVSSGRGRIHTWSGDADRDVSLSELGDGREVSSGRSGGARPSR